MTTSPPEGLAPLLVHEDADLQRQGLALLDALPELDSPDLDVQVAEALRQRWGEMGHWRVMVGDVQTRTARQIATVVSQRLGWARRLCRQQALPWEDVDFFFPHRQGGGRSRLAAGIVRLTAGVLVVEVQHRPLDVERLLLPVPEDHPLWTDRAWVKRTGRRVLEGLWVYLPLLEETAASPFSAGGRAESRRRGRL